MAKSRKNTMAQLQKAIRPVLKAARYFEGGTSSSAEGRTEYTVEQLALASNTSVRTIRNYQDKGLLESPTLRGRKGFYYSRHLARLKLISSLLERGFSVNAIRELLDGLESGLGINEFLGVESALTSPWSDEETQIISLSELYEMFAGYMTPETLKKSQELELFSIKGSSVQVNSMALLEVGAKLASKGIPLMNLLIILERMRDNVQKVANDFVKLVTTHVLEPYESDDLPPKEELPELTSLVWELRPLAEKAVSAELSRAMGEAANNFLADKMAAIISRASVDANDKSKDKLA